MAKIKPRPVFKHGSPLLAEALKVARKRFAHLDGVCGFGVGRKFHETTHSYGAQPRRTRGLCIRVLVRKKKPRDALPRDQRIPASIEVRDPKTGERRRVMIDVGTAGNPTLATTFVHTWPTASYLQPGRLFSRGVRPASSAQDEFRNAKEVATGTIGAVLKCIIDGSLLVVSAGHVFIDYASGYNCPDAPWAIGTRGRKWQRLVADYCLPRCVRDNRTGIVTDALAFRPNRDMVDLPARWPTRLPFDHQFAAEPDKELAIHTSEYSSFVLVERDGGSVQSIPVDIRTGDVDLKDPLKSGGAPINYGTLWQYKFRGSTTIPGDSGAPVLVPTAGENSCRLLGFHVLHDTKDRLGYAVDAGRFLSKIINSGVRGLKIV